MGAQTILLIEDNPLDARLIREFLRHPPAGLGELVWAHSMEEGLSQLAGSNVAIVLMDLFLPDSEGLLGLSRVQSRTFAIPIIVLTGLQDENLAVDALKAGAQDYLVKGRFDENLLKRSIQYALERHRLLHTLQVYEERYALAVRAANVGIWDWNPITNEIHFSSRWKEILGYSDTEFPADPDWARKLVHPDDLHQFLSQVEKHLKGELGEVETELRIRHHDGRYLNMRLRRLVARDSSGRPYRLVGSMVDVTQQRQMEQALAEEKEQLSVTLASIADGVIATDTHGLVRLINPVAEQLTGWSSSDAVGRRLADVFPIMDDTVSEIWTPEAHARGRSSDHARTIVHRDGTERLIEVAQSTMHGPNRIERGKVLIFRDVTERKKAELARANLAAIVESTDGAIYSKSLDGIITSWNPGAEKMLGYPSEAVIGQSDEFLKLPGNSRLNLALTQRLTRGETTEYSESQLQHQDGHLTDVALTKSLIKNPDGEVIGIATIAHDITQRKAGERQLALYREQLETLIQARTRELTAANRELEAFCYSVSHDLRAPLRSIDGFTQALLEDYKHLLDPEGQEYIERTHAATQRMAQLIEDLLNLSRVTRSELRHEPVDLSSLAQAIVQELRRTSPTREVEVVIQPDLTVSGDSHLFRAVLENLLGNAWKFTSKQAHARIDFCAKSGADGKRVYEVRDNGAGFDMAYAKKLFTPFQRLHGATEFEGTGIGLAICQRVIHRHGGEIWAEGKVGHGAVVFFTVKPDLDKEEPPHDLKGDSAGRGQPGRRGDDPAGLEQNESAESDHGRA